MYRPIGLTYSFEKHFWKAQHDVTTSLEPRRIKNTEIYLSSHVHLTQQFIISDMLEILHKTVVSLISRNLQHGLFQVQQGRYMLSGSQNGVSKFNKAATRIADVKTEFPKFYNPKNRTLQSSTPLQHALRKSKRTRRSPLHTLWKSNWTFRNSYTLCEVKTNSPKL